MRNDETRSTPRLPLPLVIGVCWLGGLSAVLLLIFRVQMRSAAAGERGVMAQTKRGPQRCHDLLRHLWRAALGLATLIGALAAVTALFR